MKSKILLQLIMWLLAFKAYGQDSTLFIGLKEAPPFVIFNEQGEASGLSIDFWKLVADDLDLNYSFKKYNTLSELVKAVENGETDMSINPITVTDRRMQTLSFSQPFFISGTAMARKYENSWMAVVRNIFSWQFFSAVAILLGVIFLFGVLIWYFERKRNGSQFGKGAKGIGDGFWWSAVTMTTVGYGDKAPLTKWGRVVGFIWMFAAIIMISSLTAGIASSLTVQSLEAQINSVEDLKRYKVGTISASSSSDYLDVFSVESTDFSNVIDGLRAVEAGSIDVFVYDRPILNYYLEQENPDDVVLSPANLKTDYYSFSFKRGNALRDYIDPSVVKALKSDSWNYRLKSQTP